MTNFRTKYSPAATVEDRLCGARELTTFLSLPPDQWAEMHARLVAVGHGGTLPPLRVKELMGLAMAQAAEEEAT